MTDTIAWYDRNATDYANATIGIDMAPLRARFCAALPALPADILDAGCGSGRDALAFRELGHTVTAFDASAAMARIASRTLSGLPVRQRRFEEIDERDRYDGIWCCASLLHITRADLPGVFSRLVRALRPGGAWYLCFQAGDGDRVVSGKRYTDMTETALVELLNGLPAATVLEMWRTAGKRAGREHVAWLNALVRRERP